MVMLKGKALIFKIRFNPGLGENSVERSEECVHGARGNTAARMDTDRQLRLSGHAERGEHPDPLPDCTTAYI